MPAPGPSQDRQQQQQEINDVLDELDNTLAVSIYHDLCLCLQMVGNLTMPVFIFVPLPHRSERAFHITHRPNPRFSHTHIYTSLHIQKVYQVVDGIFLGKKPTKIVVDDLCDEVLKFNVQLHKLQVATKEPTAQDG